MYQNDKMFDLKFVTSSSDPKPHSMPVPVATRSKA